jgi:hypothetical protein
MYFVTDVYSCYSNPTISPTPINAHNALYSNIREKNKNNDCKEFCHRKQEVKTTLWASFKNALATIFKEKK